MSTVKFIEHNGKRVLVDDQKITTEVRCDLCGELVDRAGAVFIDVTVTYYYGASARPQLTVDAHPSCAEKTINHFLIGPVT